MANRRGFVRIDWVSLGVLALVVAGAGAFAWHRAGAVERLLARDGSLDADGVRETVELAAEHSDPHIRVRAMARLRGEGSDAEPALRQVWNDGAPAHRAVALEVLFSRSPKEGIALIRAAMPAADRNTKLVYIKRAGSVVCADSAKLLAEALSDSDPAIREAVCNVLRTADYNSDGWTVAGRFRDHADVLVGPLDKLRNSDKTDEYIRIHANCAVNILTDNQPPCAFRQRITPWRPELPPIPPSTRPAGEQPTVAGRE